MHIARTSGFAKCGTNAARKFGEKRRLADDVVGTFGIPCSDSRIEFGHQVTQRATRTVTERDSTTVAA